LPRLRRAAHKHFRRGPCWSPCPRLRLAGSTPSGDDVPHCLTAAAPPMSSPVRKAFLKKALAPSPAGAKNSEEWRAICLQIVRRYRNRPEGGMPATEYCARACTVEIHLCPARRRRGKRALLGGPCGAVGVEWTLRARKSRFWRFGVWNYPPHPLRAL
jgi:hypothetical protein